MAKTNFFDFAESLRKKKTPPPAHGQEKDALSVAQLTAQIDRALKTGLPASILVRGEVSNFKLHDASGHAYFTLKDASACIDCVMFRDSARGLKFKPADGMELLATGRVGLYAQRGRYQFYVSSLSPLGQGALELAFQQMRAKLEAEGLFTADRKKPLPVYPQRIALVTSTGTAALQDMLKVLLRFPFLKLFVYHVPVQSEGAATHIAAAIKHLHARHENLGNIDLILLARGGGSLEDLWQFNEEAVARAMAGCRIPIVTGIGHEVDVSIADLVADYHAHTPTEAAQVAVANWRNAGDFIDASALRLSRQIRMILADARQRLVAIERHEVFRRPTDRINQLRQFLDDRQKALSLAVSRRLSVTQRRLADFAGRIRELHPRHLISLARQRVTAIQSRLGLATSSQTRSRGRTLDHLAARLNAVGPQQVLSRGYSITALKNGTILRNPAQARSGDTLITTLAEGKIESTVEDSRQLKLFDQQP